jgi:hypothetical protein
LQEFHAIVSGDLEFDILAELELSATTGVHGEIELISDLPVSAPIYIQAGPFPIVICPEFDLLLGAEASSSESLILTGGAETDNSIEAGFRWSRAGGFETVYEKSLSGDVHGSQVSAQVGHELRVYLKPRLSFMFYRMAGPHVAAEPYLSESGTTHLLKSEYCTEWSLGVTGEVGANMEFLDWGLSADLELVDWRFALDTDCESLEDIVVAHYPFSGNANDHSGNGNHGMVNGPTLTADRFGNPASAYDFDGIDDYIRVPHSRGLDFGTNDFSVSVFVHARSIVEPGAEFPGSVIMDKRYTYDPGMHTPGYNQWQLKWWLGNHMLFWTYSYSSSGIESPGDLEFYRWYHVVAVRESSTMSVYIDAKLAAEESLPIRDVSTPMDMFIGVDGKHFLVSAGSKCFFDGAIDDIRVYCRALSQSEIDELYQEGGWPLGL